MAKNRENGTKPAGFTQGALRLLILLVSSLLIFASLVLPELITRSNIPAGVGEAASQEILAPYSITYESKVLTERARTQAAAAVPPVFLPADPSISRHQLETLDSVLYYISTVRKDNFSTPEQKLQDLAAISSVKLSSAVAAQLLELDEQDWQEIEVEARRVLEQVMRDTIRSDNLSQIRSNLPAVIDFSFRPEDAQLVIALVSPLITPTSLFSEEQTNAAREQARAGIEPISRQIIAGEVIVRRGQIIREEDYEALNVFGLAKPVNQTDQVITSAVLTGVIAVLAALYFQRRQDQPFFSVKALLVIAGLFLIFLALGRFLVVDRTIVPYLYPVAAFGLTLSIIFNLELGIVMSMFLAILMVFDNTREAELGVFYILPAVVGMLTIGRARRISAFLVAGLLTGIAGMAVVVAFRLGDTYTDLLGLTSLIASALIYGLASGSLALLLQYVVSQILDIPTALQLLEVSRPDHPLLQYILRNAPGSYQHSLLVSNLAEQAAEAVGADRMLVRVGALFHDAGKANNPAFFIENQVKDKLDSHDNLDPATAAATVIQHVHDGVELAKKYHLPSRVIDFIREHHGTMLTLYQYSQAAAAADDPESVDKALFTYPGPKPQSRETAIVMLSDGTEARSRAETPRSDDEIRALIRKTIDMYKNEGQLDATDLTLKDLSTIEDSFFRTLQRSYHPRIQYPTLKPNGSAVSKGSDSAG
ncbi:MAG TPA: HDIG domain-containing protein [Anaerolineaceae bacterium]|nr:HDIG domain-containing protein [Anaerolineaceae bacterium]